uniref:Uncharacterized protein n=1 Tax=Arundo donax TaxID=35708 RepID=A0A0A9C7S4_ARUDO
MRSCRALPRLRPGAEEPGGRGGAVAPGGERWSAVRGRRR